ncbi:MAG: hypothetical protein ACLTUE_06520, partial [Oscillospiraceae bacterium]
VRRQSRQRLRNTSNFSNRWIDEKDPTKAEAAIVWCCLNSIIFRRDFPEEESTYEVPEAQARRPVPIS